MSGTLNQLLRDAGPLGSVHRAVQVAASALNTHDVIERAKCADPTCCPPPRVAWRFTIQRNEFGELAGMTAEPLPLTGGPDDE